ncbi:hypothetical protein Alsa1_CDS0170 [Staphylococcus phage Alsa_1]|nr:hypothetical protein Alsa1_CDS0170 [Staphylococcus phage Alsa_1]WNM50995.1 hypothetical protein Alsa3_CDS0126 [Staphylococcus phage Alsa_3]WNM51252.1 hypothetical protein Alsa4_CDS0122 [Staphylococcus phage Alsa_4]WNM56157.1 hypothetical protein CoNPh38_CDS0281 [Staphylococcus phage S-CoN_Ph38]
MFKLTKEEMRLIANYFRLNLYKKVNGFKLYNIDCSKDMLHLKFKKDRYTLYFSICKYFMNCKLYKKVDGNLMSLHDFDAKRNPKIKNIREVIMTYTKLENYKSNEEYINVNIDWDKE